MLNLLSLQAELIDLEVQLENIIKEDETSEDTDRMLHTIDFRELRAHAKEGDDLHWQMLLEIRAKLQEYSITLRLQMCSETMSSDTKFKMQLSFKSRKCRKLKPRVETN